MLSEDYCTKCIANIVPSEARFLLGLNLDRMASAHTFRVASKRSFSLVRVPTMFWCVTELRVSPKPSPNISPQSRVQVLHLPGSLIR